MHEVEVIFRIEIHGGMTVIPPFKLQHMIIWETVLQNVLMTMVVMRAQNGMNVFTLVPVHGNISK